MTHYLDKEAYKDRMRRNGAHSRGGIGRERKAALARATEKAPVAREDEQVSATSARRQRALCDQPREPRD